MKFFSYITPKKLFKNKAIKVTIFVATFFCYWYVAKSATEVLDITAVVPGANIGSYGGAPANSFTSVTFSGFGAPNSRLVLLRDGQIINSVSTKSGGEFLFTINAQPLGQYNYGFYIEDIYGNISAIYPVSLNIDGLKPAQVSGILLPPSTSVSTSLVSGNSYIDVTGYAIPGSTIIIEGNEPGLGTVTAVADAAGKYSAKIKVGSKGGEYALKIKSARADGVESGLARSIFYTIIEPQNVNGNQPSVPVVIISPGTNPGTIPASPDTNQNNQQSIPPCADPNQNKRVNLVDFSVLLFWNQKPNPPKSLDCNNDDLIDITDFSILMYYWTG